MIVYFDSSSIVKWFIDEEKMALSRKIRDKAGISLTSPIAFPEVMSAFHRAGKEKYCSTTDLKLIREEFSLIWPNFQLVEINAFLIQQAGNLVFTHGLKGYDSVHLASALTLKNTEEKIDTFFSCFDSKLNRAAEKEGLIVH